MSRIGRLVMPVIFNHAHHAHTHVVIFEMYDSVLLDSSLACIGLFTIH